MKTKKGFSLIELLVVLLIIGILAAIALPQYFKTLEASRAAEAVVHLDALRKGYAEFALLMGHTPNVAYRSWGSLDNEHIDIAIKRTISIDVPLSSRLDSEGFEWASEYFGYTLGESDHPYIAAMRIANLESANPYGYALYLNYYTGEVFCYGKEDGPEFGSSMECPAGYAKRNDIETDDD